MPGVSLNTKIAERSDTIQHMTRTWARLTHRASTTVLTPGEERHRVELWRGIVTRQHQLDRLHHVRADLRSTRAQRVAELRARGAIGSANATLFTMAKDDQITSHEARSRGESRDAVIREYDFELR